MEFVECHGIKECVQKAILEKNFSKSEPILMLLKMVWHMHKDNSNKDLQCHLPNNILF